MADISEIQIGSDTYNVKDSSARSSITTIEITIGDINTVLESVI